MNVIYNVEDKYIEIDNDENDINNKTYVRKSINFKNSRKLSLKRYVKDLDSSNINNSFENGNIKQANNSLIKKSIIK